MKEIQLQAPDKERGASVMQALADRRTERVFADKELSLRDLSDLLWAAGGINRPATGHRTSPTALNAQDVDIYVVLPDGGYLYRPERQVLEPVAEGDQRLWVAGPQDFMVNAPVFLVFVSDISRFPSGDEGVRVRLGAYDVGIVSQNVNLFCAAVGLATVPRASMDIEKLREVLRLKDSQYPMMNNPVGYRP